MFLYKELKDKIVNSYLYERISHFKKGGKYLHKIKQQICQRNNRFCWADYNKHGQIMYFSTAG